MATWLIVPALLTKTVSPETEFTQAVQNAYCSFGIAWRLLDDINDIEKDMTKGTHSAVYLCLPENIRSCWGSNGEKQTASRPGNSQVVLECVLENGVVATLRERICRELESAAFIAEAHGLDGMGG